MPIEYLSLEQGSEEWLRLRKNHIGASEVAAVMGKCPFKKALDIYKDKTSEAIENKTNFAMKRGQRLEPTARAEVNRILDMQFSPTTCLNSEYPWLIASLDGLYQDKILEIKCPGAKTFETVCKTDTIPFHYQLQMQTQMLVTELKVGIFACYFEGNIKILHLDADRSLQEQIVMKTKEFWDRISKRKPPEEEIKLIPTIDPELLKLSEEYATAHRFYSHYKALMDELKETIKEKAAGRNLQTNYLQITHNLVRGSFDVERIAQEFKIENIDSYRKEDRVQCTIRVAKKKGEA